MQGTTTAAANLEDENVRIAIRALGEMRNGGSPGQASSSTIQVTPQPGETETDFVSRVSHLPLVNTAFRAYESTKASSRVVKYGAEMMESSVKTISRPVIDRLPSVMERLPVNVNSLDEFACRQLDRFGYGSRSSPTDRDRSLSTSQQSSHLQVTDGPDSRTPTPTPSNPSTEVVQRSTWQAVLLEAGGLGAAVSEESMRKLKYCLQWLQYATAHIDSQILVLRDFIAALQGQSNGSSPEVSPAHLRILQEVRRDVVHTVRQVVDVVSKYAGGALPEPARSRVRGFILHLPQRWASAATHEGASGGGLPRSASSSSVVAASGARVGRGTPRYAHQRERGMGADPASHPSSPISSRSTSPSRSFHNQQQQALSKGAATQAATRILALATESLDMMRGVTGVVKDSLDRADAWVGRFKTAGLRGEDDQQQQHKDEFPPVPEFGFGSSSSSPGRRTRSASYSSEVYDPSIPSSSTTPSFPSTPMASYPSTPMDVSLSSLSLSRFGVPFDHEDEEGDAEGIGGRHLAKGKGKEVRVKMEIDV